jgi:hypothetical protein
MRTSSEEAALDEGAGLDGCLVLDDGAGRDAFSPALV